MIAKRSFTLRVTALAAAVALVVPAALFAGGGGGHGGGGGGGHGGGGGGYHGGGYGGYHGGYGGYGGYGYGRGYGGYGYGRGYGGYGYGLGFYGLGFGYGPGYGLGGYGYDYGLYGDPFAYPYAAGPYDSAALVAGGNAPPVDSRRFYPPDVETAPPPVESDRALVAVRLPADAKLWFQGTEMRMGGPARIFRSPPLETGKSYRYDVTARWMENGKPVEVNRAVTVQAGQRALLDLTAPQ